MLIERASFLFLYLQNCYNSSKSFQYLIVIFVIEKQILDENRVSIKFKEEAVCLKLSLKLLF